MAKKGQSSAVGAGGQSSAVGAGFKVAVSIVDAAVQTGNPAIAAAGLAAGLALGTGVTVVKTAADIVRRGVIFFTGDLPSPPSRPDERPGLGPNPDRGPGSGPGSEPAPSRGPGSGPR